MRLLDERSIVVVQREGEQRSKQDAHADGNEDPEDRGDRQEGNHAESARLCGGIPRGCFVRAYMGRVDPSTAVSLQVHLALHDMAGAKVKDEPFVGREELNVTHREGELYVTVGPYKREISLPRVLKGKTVTAAKLEEGMLRVVFGSARS